MFKLSGRGLNLIETLSNLRTRALRKGVWYAALTNQERILAGLINRHVKIVKNSTLATVIARIIVKLIPAIRNAFWDRIERMGRSIAESSARAACSMGWNEASKWPDDLNVVRWYGLTAHLFSSMHRGVGSARHR